MCGIAGIFEFKENTVSLDLLRSMADRLRHRGPDDWGFHNAGSVGLAHTRLSIIDLAGGQQPMSNTDASLWITFNGEIFNYVELRQELLQKGYRFATHSDTEVILNLYAEYGEGCVQRMNGQWAFAIWDTKRQQLFLSRDRLGVCPLYFSMTNQSFSFASEVKALFANPALPRELDIYGLDQVFTFWHTLAPRTVFKGIQELPPAHSLIVADRQLRLTPYWQLSYAPAETARDVSSWQEELLALLQDATRLRLRSDVPVGAYLSGGLDSSVVTALITRLSAAPLKTFSVSFTASEYDESCYQQEVSRYLETDHSEIRCAPEDIRRVFPEVVWHAEKPLLRAAPAPLFLLSSLVRSHGYKVALTGEGSDEALGGYDLFKEAKIRRFWGRHPDSIIRPLLLKRLYPYMPSLQAQPLDYLKAFFQTTPEDLANPFFSHLPRWKVTSWLKLFFSPAVKAALAGYNACEELEQQLPAEYYQWDSLSQAQYLETTGLFPGYILSSQGDRVSMAHAVEIRSPFFDHRLVEFAGQIPPRLRMNALDEKHLLKRAAAGLIPDTVRARHKQPYRAPDAQSFLTDGAPAPDQEYIGDLLSPGRIQEYGIFQVSAVQKLLEKLGKTPSSSARDNMALLGILSTQLLAQQLAQGAAGAPTEALATTGPARR